MPDEVSAHRLSLRRSLGTAEAATPRTSFDGAALRLPQSPAVFPAAEANGALHLWLTAAAAHAPPHQPQTVPLRGRSDRHQRHTGDDCNGAGRVN